MDTWGLVVHDEDTFFTKVVNRGTEQGIFTRDRADELIRISIAMANKYVLHKEVDFRSAEALAQVQQTVLKLVGVGLEIKSKSNEDEALRLLMDVSPVEVFRLAFTRVEKLRLSWHQLLLNHRIEIFVSSEEFKCLTDLTCQRLAQMSVFTDSEIYTIKSLTLEDELFTSLSILEYYEAELTRYQFILRLREILPFSLLNRSPNVRAENLTEVDAIREAFINTLVISTYLDLPDPVDVSTADVRELLSRIDGIEPGAMLPEDLENVVIDLIHELGEGLDEDAISSLTEEIVKCCDKLVEMISTQADTVSTDSPGVFFKRWSRMVILSDVPDPVEDILSTDGPLDEYAFEILIAHLLNMPEQEAEAVSKRLPWKRLVPDQVIRLFQAARDHEQIFAAKISLSGFTMHELIDLLEGVDHNVVKMLLPEIKKVLSASHFSMEELELLATLPHNEGTHLLRHANPPADMSQRRILTEFMEGSETRRRALFYSCWGSELFPELFLEAWSLEQEFIKKLVKSIPAPQIGSLLLAASGGRRPALVEKTPDAQEISFDSKEVNSLYRSLPASKRKAALKFFQKDPA